MRQKATIHIVDDDDSVREMVSLLVQSAGYRALEYCSALKFLESKPVAGPACIILDVSMPGLTGIELQETLNQVYLLLPSDYPNAMEAVL